MGQVHGQTDSPDRVNLSSSARVLFNDIKRITIDQLVLFENIGWGTTGVIKRAMWDGTEVAVKQFFPDTTYDKFEKSLENYVKHPNVIKILAVCVEPGKLCYVMEYLPHGNLRAFLKQSKTRPTVWPLLYRIACDIAEALLHFHDHGLIHSDVNASNILLADLNDSHKGPVAKITNFESTLQIAETKADITNVQYMAPELLALSLLSPTPATTTITSKVDVYSFGMLLYEMISQKDVLYLNAPVHMNQLAEQVRQGYRPPLPQFCPPSVADLIQACWQQQPSNRPDFIEILEKLKILGKLWKELNLDQLLEDMCCATDTESEFEMDKPLKPTNWDDITLTDIDYDPPTVSPLSSLSSSHHIHPDPEEEQDSPDYHFEVFSSPRGEQLHLSNYKSTSVQQGKSPPPSPHAHFEKPARCKTLPPKFDKKEYDKMRKKYEKKGKTSSKSSSRSTNKHSAPVIDSNLSPVTIKRRNRFLDVSGSKKSPSTSPNTTSKKKQPLIFIRSESEANFTESEPILNNSNSVEESISEDISRDNITRIENSENTLEPQAIESDNSSSSNTTTKSNVAVSRRRTLQFQEEKFRNLSKARSNLHQLLTSNEFTSSSEKEDTGLIIQVLRAALHRETLKVNELKKQRHLLSKRLVLEQRQRSMASRRLSSTTNELVERSRSITHANNNAKGSSIMEVLVENKESEEEQKWCELSYTDIVVEDVPYLYSYFGVWYKVLWQSYPMRFCIVIGGIHNELVPKFRKLSTLIQSLSNHPNICNVVGVVSKDPNFGILVNVSNQYIELQQAVSSGTLTYRNKLYIMRHIALAIAHCHSNGRSVGWLNNRAVFVHFHSLHTQLLHTCNLFYFSQKMDADWEKYRWHAPETFYGRIRSSIQGDCYSLGLLMWFMFTEKEPFEGPFGPARADQLLSGWRPSFSSEFPEELKSLVAGCWARKPDQRISAQKVMEAVNELFLKEEAEVEAE